MKVLLCENEDVTRAAIEFRLTRQGHTVVRAKNGKEAQKLLAESPFDLLLADMAMTGVKLPDLMRWLRAEQRNDLPTILIADLDEDNEPLMEAMQAGADDFITKPFKPVEMQLRIRRLLEKKKDWTVSLVD